MNKADRGRLLWIGLVALTAFLVSGFCLPTAAIAQSTEFVVSENGGSEKVVSENADPSGAEAASGEEADESDETNASLAEQSEFFESRIRPLLIDRCLDCHSEDSEASGGLLLDSKEGWMAGGDSGDAIVAGELSGSLLWKAVSYDDPSFQMPPDGKLSDAEIRDLKQWIESGAFDPRSSDSASKVKASAALSVDQAAEHWAYRPIESPRPPTTSLDTTSSKKPVSDVSPIDRFIAEKLADADLEAADSATPAALARRIYYDLTGLPPTPDQLLHFLSDPSELAYENLVDNLLDSPRFGEHFARRWMDVVRYADSITLRGFVLPEAWRYRDYLIDAFADDRPFDLMVREQLAGDLLTRTDMPEHWDGEYGSLTERQRRLVATGFLTLGNTNLEQQDKTQLEMDVIDEQLEVIGRAFLGQTIGCARCHDHKFDPIPTADYYGLAGIFRTVSTLKHENVSKWIERPLPISESEQLRYQGLAEEAARLGSRIAELKKELGSNKNVSQRVIEIASLPGVIVDSADAKLVGEWTISNSVGRNVGGNYIHDQNAMKGEKSATFEPTALEPGQYEVRLAYSADANRTSKLSISVFSADGEAQVTVNQKKSPAEDGVWQSLGKYRFEEDGQAFVLISNSDTDGHVILDAVQFLRLDGKETVPDDAVAGSTQRASELQSKEEQRLRELKSTLAKLESKKQKLARELAQRPKYLTFVEQGTPQDIAIHVRGDVHNLSDVVPRGFLTALPNARPKIAAKTSGRREFANWVASEINPLTARVYANRVWSWLMGQGLVSSINNFGTTGEAPSHPELLDWLAQQLMKNNWSTKQLVRMIVLSDSYKRRIVPPGVRAVMIDPNNRLYWSGSARRLSVEAIRDSMLQISGELDLVMHGSLIRSGTAADYNYEHQSTRRSVYHPVFRNSLPELYEAFDFADTSVSTGRRPRSTVAPQALVLLNHPWITARVEKTTDLFYSQYMAKAEGSSDKLGERLSDSLHGADATGGVPELVRSLYLHCFSREPTAEELKICAAFLQQSASEPELRAKNRIRQLVRSLFASIDFRYLD